MTRLLQRSLIGPRIQSRQTHLPDKRVDRAVFQIAIRVRPSEGEQSSFNPRRLPAAGPILRGNMAN